MSANRTSTSTDSVTTQAL